MRGVLDLAAGVLGLAIVVFGLAVCDLEPQALVYAEPAIQVPTPLDLPRPRSSDQARRASDLRAELGRRYGTEFRFSSFRSGSPWLVAVERDTPEADRLVRRFEGVLREVFTEFSRCFRGCFEEETLLSREVLPVVVFSDGVRYRVKTGEAHGPPSQYSRNDRLGIMIATDSQVLGTLWFLGACHLADAAWRARRDSAGGAGGDAPAWLARGIVDRLDRYRASSFGCFVDSPTRIRRLPGVARSMRHGTCRSAEAILRLTTAEIYGRDTHPVDIEDFEAEACALSWFLWESDAAIRPQFRSYLLRLWVHGEDPDEALSVFGDLADLSELFERTVRRDVEPDHVR